MKVFNLRCGAGHGFEGWFASEDDFQSQLGRSLVSCPLCGDAQVVKMPSAPRLNLSGASAEPAPARRSSASAPAGGSRPVGGLAPVATALPSIPAELQALWVSAVRQVVAQTDDVGERFPEEVRRIHYGEVEPRGIRGKATPEQRAALSEEGIEIVALPVPPGFDGPLQ